jgi:hypothetical protein
MAQPCPGRFPRHGPVGHRARLRARPMNWMAGRTQCRAQGQAQGRGLRLAQGQAPIMAPLMVPSCGGTGPRLPSDRTPSVPAPRRLHATGAPNRTTAREFSFFRGPGTVPSGRGSETGPRRGSPGGGLDDAGQRCRQTGTKTDMILSGMILSGTGHRRAFSAAAAPGRACLRTPGRDSDRPARDGASGGACDGSRGGVPGNARRSGPLPGTACRQI